MQKICVSFLCLRFGCLSAMLSRPFVNGGRGGGCLQNEQSGSSKKPVFGRTSLMSGPLRHSHTACPIVGISLQRLVTITKLKIKCPYRVEMNMQNVWNAKSANCRFCFSYVLHISPWWNYFIVYPILQKWKSCFFISDPRPPNLLYTPLPTFNRTS